MYAIIRAGGHQEKVEAGAVISVDRRKEPVGESVTFTPLMVHQDDGTVVSDKGSLGEGDAQVVATVLQHTRADKIDVFQYRNKTGYRRHIGHRQPLTLLEISEIRFAGTVATAPPPAAEDEAEGSGDGDAEGAGDKKAPPSKKSAKKASAKKKTAAKKTAAKKTATKKTAKTATAKQPPKEDAEPPAAEEKGDAGS